MSESTLPSLRAARSGLGNFLLSSLETNSHYKALCETSLVCLICHCKIRCKFSVSSPTVPVLRSRSRFLSVGNDEGGVVQAKIE